MSDAPNIPPGTRPFTEEEREIFGDLVISIVKFVGSRPHARTLDPRIVIAAFATVTGQLASYHGAEITAVLGIVENTYRCFDEKDVPLHLLPLLGGK